MEVFNFLNTTITGVPQYIHTHPVYFGIIIALMLLFTIVTLRGAWKLAREYEMILAKVLYMAITILSCMLMYPISIVFVVADEISELNPDAISNRFLAECIVAIIIYSVLEAVVDRIALGRKGLADDVEEKAKIMGHIVYGAICVGVTALFVYSDAESALQNWGFSLFGKQLGQWVFNGYLAAILSFLLNLAKEIIFIPFLAIFGNPYAHLNQLLEDD
jgi:hypothetical protein